MQLKIINAHILTPAGSIPSGALLVDKGKIISVSPGNNDHPGSGFNDPTPADTIIDAKGQYLSPGFIDIHVHGGAGHDFMDNTVEAFLAIARLHAQHGATSMTPTTLSSGHADLLKTLDTYAEAHPLNHHGAQFIGMHIEGPYFSMEQRGAQDPRYIRNPDPAEYEPIIQKYPFVRRWSVAPELEGAMTMGRYLVQHNILPSLAHTNAIDEEVFEAFDNGYTLATHFYNAMSTVSRRNAFRYAGVIEAGLLLDDMSVEIIADGRHLPATLLKLVYKIKGPDKIALITDAMRAAGTRATSSILGRIGEGIEVLIEDDVAKLPDRTAFAGSIATADRLVRTMIQLADIPLKDAITMMTATPARIMGVADKKGAIRPGMDADLVLFDDNIDISHTIIGGNIVFQS
ncbi:MAG TPA: N-acetylglucosamine-6-phosphate deacetylase [Puia sp.]|nr:N-acetylglucosamine-6-phosphate deacetylase [Puia sp.]